ncbi:MAG TPA: hypothetical protein VFE40_12915, partial [Jatrophihabitantaceae bacterium]|nr:hypothetical protein [Jatrophihabitantaceae bacterium]
MSRFRLPRRAGRGFTAAARRLLPARVAERVTSGWLVVGLLVVLTFGTGGTAVTALALKHHGHPALAAGAAGGPLPPAPAGVLDPVQAPFSVNTPGLKRHHGRHLVSATLLLTGDHPLSQRAVHRLQRLAGVHRVQPVSAGHARVMGHKAFVLGVDPTAFRPWTPESTAASNALWQSISGGDIAVSF